MNTNLLNQLIKVMLILIVHSVADDGDVFFISYTSPGI